MKDIFEILKDNGIEVEESKHKFFHYNTAYVLCNIKAVINQCEALYIINSAGIAYHQNEVLYIIKSTEMHTSCDDIRLRQ